MNKPPSEYQRRVLDWLRRKHPNDWVATGGVNLQNCRGLEKRGLVELRGKPGSWEVRLTIAGRAGDGIG